MLCYTNLYYFNIKIKTAVIYWVDIMCQEFLCIWLKFILSSQYPYEVVIIQKVQIRKLRDKGNK